MLHHLQPRLSLRFVIGLAASLILHGLWFGLLMRQFESGDAKGTVAPTALLVEWQENPEPKRVRLPTPQLKPTEPVAPRPDAPQPVAAQVEDVQEPLAKASAPAEPELDVALKPERASESVADPLATPGSGYLWEVLGHLRRFQEYPERARRDGIEGTVWLHARVSRRGEVLRTNVARSSGSGALDQAARRLMARASPLPPPPDNAFAITDLHLPVEYRLQRE